jgi:hypothetical protein
MFSMCRAVTTSSPDGGDGRGLVDFLLADAGGVHVGFVGQVHQVVDHQAVVAPMWNSPPP